MKSLAIAGASSPSPHACPFRSSRADDLQERVMALGGKDCKDSTLTCVDIEVPYDHAHPDSGNHLSLHLAVAFRQTTRVRVSCSTGRRSGAPPAPPWRKAISIPSMSAEQGAATSSSSTQRASASRMASIARRRRSPSIPNPITLQHPIRPSPLPRGFVDACLQEMSHKDLLPYLGTSHAVQDLEDFRQGDRIGPRVWFLLREMGLGTARSSRSNMQRAIPMR